MRTASPCPAGGRAEPWRLREQEGLDRGSVRGRAGCRGCVSGWLPKRLLSGPEGPEALPLRQHPSERQLEPRALSWARLGHGVGPCIGAGGGLAPRWGGTGPRLPGSSWSPRGDPSLPPRAPQVAAEYRQVHQTMTQPPVRDYVPFPWTTLAHVKAEYFRALAHYHAALALCDSPRECPARPSLPLRGPRWRGLTALSRPSRGRGRLPSAAAGLPWAPGHTGAGTVGRWAAPGARGAQEAG